MTAPEWVSVDDRMPTPNVKVLAGRFGKKTNHGPMLLIHKNRPMHPWEWMDGDTCTLRITHWMQIPEPPK